MDDYNMQGEGSGSTAASDHSNSYDSLPWIFLSHSGCQKPFVCLLYLALLHAKHRFFDEDTIDSLPIGVEYPSRIFQACRACKMGVLVLSKAYVENLWPMVELQHLLQNARCQIYPLFYDIQPSDLTDQNNLERWKVRWAEQAVEWEHNMQEVQDFISRRGCNIDINFDTSSWTKNLEKLQYTSGEVFRKVVYSNSERFLLHQSEHEYIQAVVSTICTLLPPPLSLDKTIEGGQRMHREIAEVFERKECLGADGVRAVGVYGIGGSGKSTLCEVMATFYSDEFSGRCYRLEFPTTDNEVHKLLCDIKSVLPKLNVHSALQDESKIDQALNLLEEGLQRTKVFLAMDNVWGHSASEHHSFEYAQRTLLMKFMPGSKILVTSRSKEVLARLIQSRLNRQEGGNAINQESCMSQLAPVHRSVRPIVVNVPSLSELEAVKVLKSYSPLSYFIPDQKEWQSLARSCFFGEQCHPLCLKLKGIELQSKGRPWFDDEQCKGLFVSLLKDSWRTSAPTNYAGGSSAASTEKEVSGVVERSFDVLPIHLQGLFIDLATAKDYLDRLGRLATGSSFWNLLVCLTSKVEDHVTADDMFYQVLDLEYHGLLELRINTAVDDEVLQATDHFSALKIHDLHRMLAEKKLFHPHHAPNALMNHAINCDLSQVWSPAEILSKKLVFISGVGWESSRLATLLSGSPKTLLGRALAAFESAIRTFTGTRPIQGQTRVLLLGNRGHIEYGLGSRTFVCTKSLNLTAGESMKHLRALYIHFVRGIEEIDGWEGLPNLLQLHLEDLPDLRRIGDLGCLQRLETLRIVECGSLQVQVIVGDRNWEKKRLVKVGDHLPKLQVLELSKMMVVEVGSTFADTFPALRILRLDDCDGLESLPDLCQLGSSLRTLDLRGCSQLKSLFKDGICSLPALQCLQLGGCNELETLPDLSNVVDLRKLEAGKMIGLLDEEIRLNMRNSACKHLKRLELPQIKCSAIDGSVSVLGLLADAVLCEKDRIHLHSVIASGGDDVPFSNLQSLFIDTYSLMTPSCRRLDVSGLPNLIFLRLSGMNWVQKLSISLSSLAILSLHRFPILDDISGLGVHHECLRHILLYDCPALESIPELPVSLNVLELTKCSALADVSIIATLTSLEFLFLDECTSLRDIPDLRHLTSLQLLSIEVAPGSRWTLSKEAVSQVPGSSCWTLSKEAVSQMHGVRWSPCGIKAHSSISHACSANI